MFAITIVGIPLARRSHVRARYSRRADSPAQSVVYYVPNDDGLLLVGTIGARAKAKAVERPGKVRLLVLDD